MIKRLAAALSLALVMVPGMATGASAQDLVESDAVDRVECLFIVTINDGHSWEECLS